MSDNWRQDNRVLDCLLDDLECAQAYPELESLLREAEEHFQHHELGKWIRWRGAALDARIQRAKAKKERLSREEKEK